MRLTILDQIGKNRGSDIVQDGSVYMVSQAGNNQNSVLYFDDGYIGTMPSYNHNSPSSALCHNNPSSQYDLSSLS